MQQVLSPDQACETTAGGAVKRARILKEGSLTLIPHGMNEQLQWAERIAQFTHQARQVP